MRFAGVDIASATHLVALVDEGGEVLVKPTAFTEDAAGYQKLFAQLGASAEQERHEFRVSEPYFPERGMLWQSRRNWLTSC
jgi:hypothetical protein